MGQIIAKSAAVDDILTDVGLTLTAAATATAAGPIDWSVAESFLRPVYTVANQVSADLAAAESATQAPVAAAAALDRAADKLLAGAYDRIYNALGRPGSGSDPLFTLLFPRGVASYADGPDVEQPERMRLLVELLLNRVHPSLDPSLADAVAADVRDMAARLGDALTALQVPRVRAGHLRSLKAVLARSAQVQLSRLKKHWRGMGRSEADIHTIIPDRPRAVRAADAAPAPATGTGEEAA